MTPQNITNYFSHTSSNVIPKDVPLNDSEAFNPDRLKAVWTHRSTITPSPTAIPSTGYWTSEQMAFFKLHYVNIRRVDWTTFICPKVAMTEFAQRINACELFLGDYLKGMHVGAPYPIHQFGDIISLITRFDAQEASTDKLAQLLLDVCNTNPQLMLPCPQRKEITVQVGALSFKSTPDGSMIARRTNTDVPAATVILIGDKKLGTDFGEYQIPGEMVAVAVYNYTLISRNPQTIFAVRIVGTAITFYRADFSADYLNSVTIGAPAEHVPIFRLGGVDNDMNIGMALENPNFNRALGLEVLCSICDHCLELFDALSRREPAATTILRLAFLQLLNA